MVKRLWISVFLLSFLAVSPSVSAKKLLCPYQAALSADDSQFVLQNTSTQQAQVVVLHNKSSASLLLNRVLVNNPGVSAGWSSQLDPDHWSAFSWQNSSFTLSCREAGTQKGQVGPEVPCSQVLELYKPIASKNNSLGSYWLVENKTRSQLIARLFKLRLLQPSSNSKT